MVQRVLRPHDGRQEPIGRKARGVCLARVDRERVDDLGGVVEHAVDQYGDRNNEEMGLDQRGDAAEDQSAGAQAVGQGQALRYRCLHEDKGEKPEKNVLLALAEELSDQNRVAEDIACQKKGQLVPADNFGQRGHSIHGPHGQRNEREAVQKKRVVNRNVAVLREQYGRDVDQDAEWRIGIIEIPQHTAA